MSLAILLDGLAKGNRDSGVNTFHRGGNIVTHRDDGLKAQNSFDVVSPHNAAQKSALASIKYHRDLIYSRCSHRFKGARNLSQAGDGIETGNDHAVAYRNNLRIQWHHCGGRSTIKMSYRGAIMPKSASSAPRFSSRGSWRLRGEAITSTPDE